MLPSTVLQREILETTRKRKALALKLVVPLLLLGPLILGSPPTRVISASFVLIIVFLGVFGTGVSLSRAKESGLLTRMAITPLSPQRIVFDHLLASFLFDLLQILPVLALFLIRYPSDLGWSICLPFVVIFSLASANIIGMLLSRLAPTSAEVHLFAALAIMLLMALSGVFVPLDPQNGVQLAAARLMPFAHTYQGFSMLSGEASLWGPGEALLSAVAILAGLFMLLMVLAGRLVNSEG